MYKPVELHLKKRRYACSCGKRFYEDYEFLARYKRLSNHLVKYIINECRDQVAFSFLDWEAHKSKITALVDVSNTFYSWREYILNALKYRYRNGVTDGFNNKLKVIKRIGYGYGNFRRFRNLILHTI